MAAKTSLSLGRLPLAAKIGVGAGVFGLVALLYFVVFYGDVSSAIASQQKQEQNLRTDLGNARQSEFAYHKDLAELTERQQRQRELNKVLPETADVPAFLSALQGVANVSGVALQSWSPLDEVKQQFFAKVPMRLAISGKFHQLAKFFFARERPFVHFLPRAPDAVRALTTSPSDDNLSFFSGHTTLAFSLATSAGTIASMRGYRLAPLTWGVGLANAFTIGYLRIGADKHYFSDVTIGALVGTAIGVGIPLIFHSPSDDHSSNPPSASVQAIVPAPMHTVFSTNGSF